MYVTGMPVKPTLRVLPGRGDCAVPLHYICVGDGGGICKSWEVEGVYNQDCFRLYSVSGRNQAINVE